MRFRTMPNVLWILVVLLFGSPLSLAGEIGVVHPEYPIGDVRRYGVFPDGTTNWQATTPYIQNIMQNASEQRIEMVWPAGLYWTSIAIRASNITFKFEAGAEFAGTIHVDSGRDVRVGHPYISNVTLKGTLVVYDRFGTINVRGLRADSIVCKSDPTKNLYGTHGRGAHIYFGSQDFDISSLVVETTESQDKRPTVHAGVAIDGYGDNPQRIRINSIWVKDSRTHGVYVTGPDHKFGSIRVDGYADGPLTSTLQDATPEASAEGKGVWFHRTSGHIGRIAVSQLKSGETDRANDRYQVAIDRQLLFWTKPEVVNRYEPKGVMIDELLLIDPRRVALGIGIRDRPSYATIGRVVVKGGTANSIRNADPTATIREIIR